jgi:HK97 family phage major capsid protein
MLLEQLRKRLNELIEAMTALSNSVVDKDGKCRSFTEDEDKKYKAHEVELAEVRSQIQRLENVAAARAQAAGIAEAATPGNPQIQVVREANCNEQGEYRGFHHFGEQLQAIARSSMPGQPVDKRQEALQRSVSGASEGIGADGGFLVQTDFQQKLNKKVHDSAILASLCEEVTISSNSNALEWVEIVEDSRAEGSRSGGVRVYRDKEAGSVSSSKLVTRKDRLQLEKMTALFYATEELLEDASALMSLVEPAFVEEMAFVTDNEVLWGDGATGEMLGVMNSPALITVAKESAQTADTIKHANVRKMKGRIWAPSKPRGIWVIGNGVEEELESISFLDGSTTPVPIYLPAGGLSQQPYGVLYGRPVREVEQAKPLGDKGDIAFLDLSQYRIAIKGGIKGAVSQHVRFLYGENTFRWTRRINGKPMWRSPLTQANGGNTKSPFVVLAVRS